MSDDARFPRAHLAVALIQYLPGVARDAVLQLAQRELSQATASRELFYKAYEAADNFSFSPEYLDQREITWLGKAGPLTVPAHPELSLITANHVLVKDAAHEIASLHQHITIANSIPLDPESPELAATIRALHEIYWLRDRHGGSSRWTSTLDPFGSLVTRDGASIFSRRAIYVSVLLDHHESARIADWSDLSPALYGLLHLHAEGVDPRVAEDSLKEAEYRSAAFYVGFAQPDSALTVSVPFPPVALTGSWDDLPPGSEEGAEATVKTWVRRREEFGSRFEPYDLSPEYPALRYNAMALLEFAGGAAYAEWRIRRRLARVMRRSWLPGLVATVFVSRRIDRLYYEARSLSMLRLPGVRDIAARLLRSRIMADAPREIDGMRASLTNGLLAFLAGVTVLLAALQLILAIFDH